MKNEQQQAKAFREIQALELIRHYEQLSKITVVHQTADGLVWPGAGDFDGVGEAYDYQQHDGKSLWPMSPTEFNQLLPSLKASGREPLKWGSDLENLPDERRIRLTDVRESFANKFDEDEN